jgi:histidinol-phosphate/aromatic aminotransferase/cobyric acid decarboxylase-like protein
MEMAEKKTFTFDQARKAGESLGVDWRKFGVNQFRYGMDVELEHGMRDAGTNVTGDDMMTTAKIALAHLNEYPDYYKRLKVMENEAEKFWSKKKSQDRNVLVMAGVSAAIGILGYLYQKLEKK